MASRLMGENMLSQIIDKGKKIKSSVLSQSEKVGNTIKNTANSGGKKWRESSTFTKACIIGSATAVLAPMAIVPTLRIAGFKSAGVAAGSPAAHMQTPTTESGSFFARCQSAGAVGAVATSTFVGVGLVAGVIAGGVTAAFCRKKPSSPSNDEKGQVVSEEEEDVEERQDAEGSSDEPSDAFNKK